MRKALKLTGILLAFTIISSTLSSCYKKKDTTAVVTVVDAAGDPVGGKEVTLTWVNQPTPPEKNECAEQVATTDVSGKARFNFNECYESGQAGVFVLDILVQGNQVGIIKIEQETSNAETVTYP